MHARAIVLTGSELSIEDVVAVAREGRPVALDPSVAVRMRQARAVVERAVERGDAVYGLTTGVGAQKRVRVPPDELAAFNRSLIEEHRVGWGPPAAPDVVRASMLALANQLARGHAGVRPELAERLVDALNTGTTPQVRSRGSIGQADLAPMADLAMGLLGDRPELAAGEALALIDTNAFSTGHAALALHDSGVLLDAAELAGAASLDALGADLGMLHAAIGSSRPHLGLIDSLRNLGRHLEGSRLWDREASRNIQDPLSFRTLPQVVGTCRDAIAFARSQVAAELNASQGNPIVVPDEDRLVSTGNFDALSLALALDLARLAIASVLTTSAERTIKLLHTPWSGLPHGLGSTAGPGGALSIVAIANQSLVTEARLLAQPVSLELASTSLADGTEDRTSLAPLGARRLAEMIELGSRIVGAELAVAARAAELRGERPLGAGTERAIRLVRDRVPVVLQGNPADLEPLAGAILSGALGLTGEGEVPNLT